MKRFCVDDETMIDYLENRLPARSREGVEKHLCECQDCRELLMLAAELNDDRHADQVESAPAALTQQAVDAVASMSEKKDGWGRRMFSSSRQLLAKGRAMIDDLVPGPIPQPAGLRGGQREVSDDFIRDHISGPDFEARVEIEKITASHFSVQVELTKKTGLTAPLRVGLFADMQEIASATLLDEAVQFEDIPNGDYALIFSKGSQQLKVYAFDV